MNFPRERQNIIPLLCISGKIIAQQILRYFDDRNISMENVMTIGSDGTAVMTGRHVSFSTHNK